MPRWWQRRRLAAHTDTTVVVQCSDEAEALLRCPALASGLNFDKVPGAKVPFLIEEQRSLVAA